MVSSYDSGFDWNGNDKNDAFDNYMDMKVSCNGSSDNNEEDINTSSTSSYLHSSKTPQNQEFKGISMGGKPLYDATKDSSGVTILKCLLSTAFCIGGIALPIVTDLGPLGTLLCIFGGLGLSIMILKNV